MPLDLGKISRRLPCSQSRPSCYGFSSPPSSRRSVPRRRSSSTAPSISSWSPR